MIETNARNELAVVPLSSRDGKHRTLLKNYQDGKTRFKHFVEVEDANGDPIKVNSKFRENHKNQDVSDKDVSYIQKTVFSHSKPALINRKKINEFRNREKKNRR